MDAIWELDLPAPEKLVLLAMASHADHSGGSVRPSVDLIAWKTGYSHRQVQRILRALEGCGLLVVEGNATGGRGAPRRYRVALEKGDKLTPFRPQKGDIYDIEPPERVTSTTQKGDIYDQKGDIAMSPESSESVMNRRRLNGAADVTTKMENFDRITDVLAPAWEKIDHDLNAAWLRGLARQIFGEQPSLRVGQLADAMEAAATAIARQQRGGKAIRSPRGYANRIVRERVQEVTS